MHRRVLYRTRKYDLLAKPTNRPNSFPSNFWIVRKSFEEAKTEKKTLKNTYTTRGKWIDATFIQ